MFAFIDDLYFCCHTFGVYNLCKKVVFISMLPTPFIDIKDTNSILKVNKLKNILENWKQSPKHIKNIQRLMQVFNSGEQAELTELLKKFKHIA